MCQSLISMFDIILGPFPLPRVKSENRWLPSGTRDPFDLVARPMLLRAAPADRGPARWRSCPASPGNPPARSHRGAWECVPACLCLLMVIDDLDVMGVPAAPDEAHPPAVLDADRVLALAALFERFEPVVRRIVIIIPVFSAFQ